MTPATRDEAVEAVRQRADIVELVSRYVRLKKVGGNYVGLCPFHAEKAPSFTVNPGKGFYHCFGCKASGDVFSFLMRMEGKDFPEVLAELAQRSGVELPRRGPGERRSREEGLRLLEINEVAASFFEQQLWSGAAGARAREYLDRRGLGEEIVRRFRVGYAPAGWHDLGDNLQRKKVSQEEAVRLGLLGKGDRGFYDLFRDRLVFPILGLDGKIRGFGARTLDEQDKGPKYINSRQSPVFDKSAVLYGLHQARSAVQGSAEVVLVEGYFDVLTPVAGGAQNLVATCGTALTESHAALLRRFCEKVITVFDADPAGMAASFRSAKILLLRDLSAYMVMLPPGEDPDSFVRRWGGDAFLRLIAGARPTIEVLAESGLREAGGDAEARTAVLKQLVPLLAACGDGLRLGNYIHLLSDLFRLGEEYIRGAVVQHRHREGTSRHPDAAETVAEVEGPGASFAEERTLVVLLDLYPRLVLRADESGVAEQVKSETLRGLVRQMIAAGSTRSDRSLLTEMGDQDLKSRLIGMSLDGGAYPQDKAEGLLEECILKIHRRNLKIEQRRLTEVISRAERDGNAQEVERLQRDKIRLDGELRALESSARGGP